MRNSDPFLGRSVVGEVPAILAMMVLLLTSSGSGADAPDRSPMTGPMTAGIGGSAGDPSGSFLSLPAESVSERPVGELFFRLLPPVGPGDKGSTYTDGALGREGAAELTASEREKLAAARAAIEAAWRAGTLYPAGVPHEVGASGPPPAGPKADLGRTGPPPAVLRPDAAACVGTAMRPLQLRGPAGLSPAEEAKASSSSLSDPNAVRSGKEDGSR